MTNQSYIKLGRWLTLLGYFSLMAGLFSWHLIFDPAAKHLMSIIIFLQLGPLMLPLRGLLNGKLYTHSWSMYLAIFYFIIGVWYAGDSDELMIGLFVITTSLTFFTGTVFYVRYTGKQQQVQMSLEASPEAASVPTSETTSAATSATTSETTSEAAPK